MLAFRSLCKYFRLKGLLPVSSPAWLWQEGVLRLRLSSGTTVKQLDSFLLQFSHFEMAEPNTVTTASSDIPTNGVAKKQILLNAFDMSTVGHLSPGQWKVS